MEDGNNSNKRKGDGEQEGRKSGCKRQNVSTVMEVFDCTVCSKPLRPPIFQCPKGNSICRHCQERLPLFERIPVQRCYIMERVVDNIFVPCKHGCSTTIAYYQKEKHERQCPCGPCLCPVSGCGFVAPIRSQGGKWDPMGYQTSNACASCLVKKPMSWPPSQ
ncbi:putative E3 ubiquitin-protein ligase SINA-like 6 [Triticum dicoccoides]|uniref:putative E3 ubiquitin-protein ligase SINA-like 6 n=1 Tax=Triticum dicoccoides TaxID=85692 RepID=UPI00188F3B59|nr:putative E3 ubiquitin-protein ligase SINA-like 6 [Triticum dicoccoides]